MHVSIVPVLTVGTFVYMYQLQLVLKLIYCRVSLTDDIMENTPMMSLVVGVPSPTVLLWYQQQYLLIYLILPLF